MSVVKVIALDPGGTTGWAKGLIREDEGIMYVASGQDVWNHVELWDNLTIIKPKIIVCERFDFRKRGVKQEEAANLISRELIGVVELYYQLANRLIPEENVQLYMQMPAEALGGYWSEDNRLKEDKVFRAGRPHANDAMRHLLQWFMFKEGFKYNKKGFLPLEA
jgi:hypothetical protein